MCLGRRISSIFFDAKTEFDDIYALIIGAYFIGLCLLIITVVFAESIRLNLKYALRLGVTSLAKWIYLTFVAGILLPLLCSVCLRLYVMDPIQRLLYSGSIIKMTVMDEWALGVMQFEIVGWIILHFDNRYTQEFRNVPAFSSLSKRSIIY